MNSLWIPRFFVKGTDGGKNSGVTAYWLIEWKKVLSIGFLVFNRGSREAYHSHAFNALTWWIKGRVTEEKYCGGKKDYSPSIVPKYTPRSNTHRVIAAVKTLAFTLRGPWKDTWFERRAGKLVTLTHGRREI